LTTNNNLNKNNILKTKSIDENSTYNLMNKSIKQFTNKAIYYDNLIFK